jgi:hypothetical protein
MNNKPNFEFRPTKTPLVTTNEFMGGILKSMNYKELSAFFLETTSMLENIVNTVPNGLEIWKWLAAYPNGNKIFAVLIEQEMTLDDDLRLLRGKSEEQLTVLFPTLLVRELYILKGAILLRYS